MQQTPVVETKGLSYQYPGGQHTLFDIDLSVARGSIYGFLGPNGSGKTTTLSLILGLLRIQSGVVELFGAPLRANRIGILKRIGSLIETPSLYGQLSAMENLEVYREIYGATRERMKEVLQIVGLESTGKKAVKRFSLGMKQRLAIALALLPRPELLILDEPTNGLDPSGIIELRQLIRVLNRDHGITILISSHILSEVEKIATHIGIIFKGKLRFQGTLPELQQFQQKGARLLLHTSDNVAACALLEEWKPVWDGPQLSLPFADQKQAAAIQRTLLAGGIDVYLLQPKENDLEQIFIDLTTGLS